MPSPQQEVYLYQVCIGVEEAIDDAKDNAQQPPPWEEGPVEPTLEPPMLTPLDSVDSQSTPTSSPSTKNIPTSETSYNPTRHGEVVGPIQTEGLRITMFGIDKVQNEAGWSVGHALYINDFFNSEWNCELIVGYISTDFCSHTHYSFQLNHCNITDAFDVDVEVILTDQTEKQYGEEEGKLRHLKEQISVEIEYTQISTFRTINPSFANLTYILQEPFASIPSRSDYRSFLQLLSPNYANVSSASPVILLPSHPEEDYESESGLE